MAYIVGFLTDHEQKQLEKRGWEVESAERYGLVGLSAEHLIYPPSQDSLESCGMSACVCYIDSSMFDIMNGPDWEKKDA